MSIWQALFLGALQGATEFLPISSSGHLVLVPWLLGWEAAGLTFGAAVHLGTLLAVLVYFREDLWTLLVAGLQSLRARRVESPQQRLAWLIVIATIPAALAGVLLEDWFEAMFASPLMVSLLLLVTGTVLWLSERLGQRLKMAEQARLPDAVAIGLAQAAAIAPGISRSGATIAAGLTRGLKRAEAARFSFLLSVPIVLGAGLMEMRYYFSADGAGSLPLAVAGGVAAALAGFLAISFLLRYLRRRSLMLFAVYCWVVGGLCAVLALLGV